MNALAVLVLCVASVTGKYDVSGWDITSYQGQDTFSITEGVVKVKEQKVKAKINVFPSMNRIRAKLVPNTDIDGPGTYAVAGIGKHKDFFGRTTLFNITATVKIKDNGKITITYDGYAYAGFYHGAVIDGKVKGRQR